MDTVVSAFCVCTARLRMWCRERSVSELVSHTKSAVDGFLHRLRSSSRLLVAPTADEESQRLELADLTLSGQQRTGSLNMSGQSDELSTRSHSPYSPRGSVQSGFPPQQGLVLRPPSREPTPPVKQLSPERQESV